MFEKEFLKLRRSELSNKTFYWADSDTEDQYLKIKDKMNIPYGPGDIEYKYNNYGFRCDDFDIWEKYPYRILFAGCSMTEGTGVPLHDTWAKQMHNMICARIGQMPFWSVASAGSGIDHMIRYIYNIKDLVKPQIIISYVPDKVRRERWFEDRWSAWSLDIDVEKNTRIMLDEKFVEYQTEKNLAMLDMVLNELDAVFLYSSSMKDFSISDYINSSKYIQKHHIPEQYDFGRDGLHAGPKTNNIMAKHAFEFFWPVIEQRLTTEK